ncbi:hypothetical protein [Cellulosimicrobium sp. CpK407]|uniref:hypothetical protein n=1 Tax=Cellulosimicrobium sp. CpK407 TaxID=3229847 RepID=UPI003F357354
MSSPSRPRRGFWYQVWRPFRVLGRGIARVLELADLVSVVVNVGRGVVWLARGAGSVVARVVDW